MEWTVLDSCGIEEFSVATRELAFELADELALQNENYIIAIIDPTNNHIANVSQFATDFL